jgi:DNA primase
MTWVDFKALRAQIDIAAVLKHYGVELKMKKGDQHQGFCPLPTHEGEKRSPSFSVNIAKGIWQCFSCRAKGNALDFACRMDGLDPANGQNVRTTALKLQKLFLSPSAGKEKRRPKRPEKLEPTKAADSPATAPPSAAHPVVVNAPLDFELKNLDPSHPYLRDRGFLPETVQKFGLGYCSRGTFQGRIVIPLHNPKGQLVGYAGRLVDDSQVSDQNPKYKFPPSRLRNDQVHEFRKNQILFNLHRLAMPVTDLVVVEGFMSVLWLTQHGFHDVVAVMGNSCSSEQAALIAQTVESYGTVWTLTDGDEGGERCAASVLTQVAPDRSVRWVKLRKGEQPTDCTADELSALLPHLAEKGDEYVGA